MRCSVSPTSARGAPLCGAYLSQVDWRWSFEGWGRQRDKGGTVLLEMALGARKIICLPAYELQRWTLILLKNRTAPFAPERLWRGFKAGLRKRSSSVSHRGVPPTLPGDPCSARGEPLDPESGTKAVVPLCSLPWANWKWPLGSYRFLSVWGTSSRGRTHRSRGVQFISGRPGRQILREKQMLLTMPHPRAMTALWSAKYFPPHPHPGEKEKGRNRNTDAEKTCVDVAGGGRHTGWPGRLGLTSIHDHVWNRQLVGLCLTPQGAQCSVVTSRSGMGVEGGKVVHERGDVCMHIADSLSWTAETNITLWCNYIPV